MPELPDVQVFKEYVDATSLHQRIVGVRSDASELRKAMTPDALTRRLDGHELRGSRRHGKHLFLDVTGTGGWLRLHFGMTGYLAYYRDDPDPEHTRLRLDFANDYHLAYVNSRKFGEIDWVDDVDTFVEAEELGPDALDLERDGFAARLAERRGSVKSSLMNQEVLAGLGNVYVDEILFQAGIHPETPADALDDETMGRLYRKMREVIERAVEARADVERMPPSFLLPRREAGASCPSCGRPLEKIEVIGRPTYLCPHEQRRTGESS